MSQLNLASVKPFGLTCKLGLFLVMFALLSWVSPSFAQSFQISVDGTAPNIRLDAPGESAFFQNAGFLDDGNNTPISLRATLVSISAGHSINVRRSGDNPTVVSNNAGLEAEVLWETFDRNTGLPISGDAAFLITDIDGSGGSPIESISALCLGLRSFTINGDFVAGVNANSSNAAQTNIRITESGGSIRGDGTQVQNGSQQEGYLQYNWVNVDNWTVSYFSTSGGRFFGHDADGDIPFDGTEITLDLIDLATIKRNVFGPQGPPASGETITWEIELSNVGPEIATNANLIDTLPSSGIDLNTVMLSFSNGTATRNNNEISWTGVTIGVNQTQTLTITALVNGNDGDTVTNSVTTAEADQSFCSSRDVRETSFVIAETPDPILEITKTASTPTIAPGAVDNLTDAGDTITYTYVIENTGNVAIDNVMPVDAGPTFGNNQTNQTLSSFTPASADLLVGESATFTATYTLTQDNVQDLANGPSQTNGVNNTATATGDPVDLPLGGQAIPTSNSSSVSTGFSLAANAEIEKTVTNEGDFDSVGDIIEYQFVITNTGNIELTQVRPRDNGPSINNSGRSGQFSQVVAVAPFTSSTTNPPNNIILQPGESQTYTATYTLAQNDLDNVARSSDPLTSIDNTATVEAQSRLGAIQNVSDSVETGFAPAPGFTITKSVTNLGGFNTVGNTINYQFSVQNTGNTTINNVTVSDSGPTFNGQPAQGNLSNISPSNANLAPATATSPGQIQVFNAQYQLRQQDIDNLLAAADPTTAIQNTATVAGIPTGGLLPPVSDTFNTGFAVEGELTLVKNVSGPSTGAGSNTGAVDEGDTLSYTFQVQNSGDITVNNIAIDDDGPLFDGVAGQGTFSSINCGATSLQPNQSTTCNATYTLAQSDIDTALANGASGTDAITNSAIATGTLSSGAALESDPDTTTASIPLVSSIEMTKTAGTPTVNFGADTAITDPGDQVSFTLLAENTGNNTLSGVTISDSLVASLSCAAITANGNTFNNITGSLEPGDNVSCTAVYTIEQSDINSGEVSNTGSVTSTDAANNSVEDDDTVRTGFTQRTSLSLNKVGTPATPTSVDQDITYTFTLENTGNVSLSDPQVIDAQCDVPGTTLTAISGFVSGDTNDDDILDSDETWTFSCTRDIDQAEFEAGDITNVATASGTPPAGLDTPMSTAGALVRAEQSTGIALDKLAGLPTTDQGVAGVVDEGDTVLYTFTVENTGNVTLNAVSVTDPLIESQPGSPTVNCPVSTLAPGVTTMCTATYSLTLDDINAGQVNNTATATGVPVTDFAIDPPSAMSGAMVTIPPAPSLTVVKTVDAITGPLSSSTELTYRYTVTNTGNVTIENVVPVDTAGPSFNNVAGASSLSAFTPLTADLEPGDDQEFVATYTLDQADINNIGAAPDATTAIDNTATATGDPVNGVLAAVPPSTVETGLATNPSLALVKTSTPLAASPAPQVGSLVNYNFSLNNNGNVDISNPQIDDALCQPSTTLTTIDSGDDGDGILQVGETFIYSCSYALTQDDLDTGTVQNTATATGQDPSGADVSDISGSAIDNDNPNITPIPQTAAWTVVKSTASVPAQAGDTLDYSFVVENTGNLSISGITVDDPKCAATPAFVGGDSDNDNALDPNETFTYSCTSIAVTQPEVNATTVDNTVTVSGTASGGVTLADADDTLQTPIVASAELSAVKSIVGAVTMNLGANATATDAGDQITYRVDVSNDGNVTIDNLSIVDPGPTFGGEAASGVTPLAFTCIATTLDPGATTSCTGVYTLTQDDVDNAIEDGGVDEVENSAFARGDNPAAVTGTTDSDPTSATASIINESLLTVVKTASAPTIIGGIDPAVTDLGGAGADTIDYTITTSNSGNTTLDNVSISDPLLAGSTLVCNVGGNPFANDGTESLAVGAEVVCTATYSLIQDDLDNAGVTNIATASAQDPAGADITSSDELLTPLTQNTSISLLKQVQSMDFAIAGDPDLPNAGDTITYEFTLGNTGNVSLSAPTVSDDLCDSPPVLDSGDDGDGILSATETFVFTCTNTLIAAEINAGDVENTASGTGTPPVDSGLPNPIAVANSVAVIAQESSISFIKMAGVPSTNVGDSSRTDEGDTISYTFDVTNTGNVSLTDIVVSDPLITDAPNNGTITCPAAPFNLDAGVTGQCTATYTLTQADIDLGSVMNEASVTGNPPVAVTPPPSAMSSAMVPIDPVPSMTIDKTASTIPTTVVAGDVITYTFTVENTGNVTIDGVLPEDNGPTFNNQAATNSLSAFDTEPGIIILGPGESQVFTATYELSQVDLDNIASSADPATAVNNSATIVGEPENGVLPPVTPSPATTGVETAPSIELIKSSVAPDPAVVGANITYTFNLENTGNVSVANPTIADALCQVPTGNLSFTNGFVSGDTGAQAGVLDVGETWVFSCTSALTQIQIDAGTVENTATANGTEPGGDPVTDISDSGNPGDGGGDDDVTNTPLNQTPSWTVVKSTSSVPVDAGNILSYTFVLDNTGNVTISAPVVTDVKCAVPVETATLTAGDLNGDNNIAPDEIFTYTCTSIAVTQDEVDAARVNNSVSIAGSPPIGTVLPPATADLSTLIAQTASWEVEKTTVSTPTAAGQTLDYTFVLRNTGNVSIGSIAVDDAKCAVTPTLAPATATAGDVDGDTQIDPNEIFTYSCTSIPVTQGEVNLGRVDNTVTISGAPPIGIVDDAVDSVRVDIDSAPALTLEKTATAPTVGFGVLTADTDEDDTIVYSFLVTNSGNVSIDSIVVNDLGQEFGGQAGTGSLSAISCPVTDLEPQQSTSCTATYTLSQDDIDNAIAGGADSASNSATVSGQDPSDVDVTSAGSTAVTNIDSAASLDLLKTAAAPTTAGGSDPAITDPGDTIDYTITVTNDGNTVVNNAQMTDPLIPAADLSCAPFLNDGTESIAVGETVTCSASYAVTQVDLNTGEVLNTATVNAVDGANSPIIGSDSERVGFTQRSSIELSKSGTQLSVDPVPQVGDIITYTFLVENTGNVSQSDPVVTDALCPAPDDSPTPVLLAGTTDISGDTNTDGILDASEVFVFSCEYAITQDDITNTEIVNTATATSTPPLGLATPTSTAGTLITAEQSFGIALDKVAGVPSVGQGILPTVSDADDTISYVFTVRNTGNVVLDNIVLTDPLLGGVDDVVTCPRTSLDPEPASGTNPSPTPVFEMDCVATYTLIQTDIDAGERSNTANVIADPVTVDPVLADDRPSADSGAMVVLPATPNLSVVKSASDISAGVSAGTVITYSYVITNTGNVTITGVTPDDSGPSFNGVAGENSLSVFDPVSIDLAPNVSQTFTATYALSQTDIDNMAAAASPNTAIDNTATAAGLPANGSLPTIPPSTVETGVLPDPSITLVKTADAPVPAAVGSAITYTFALNNDGNVTISNPTIEDAQCQSPGSVLSLGSGFESVDAELGEAADLDVGETWTFMCTRSLTQTDLDLGSVTNTAVVTGQDPAGDNVSDTSGSAADNDEQTVTLLAQTPSWNVVKSTASAPTQEGETLLYNFVVTNTGNVSISNIAVSDAKCATEINLDGGDIDNNSVLAPTEIFSYSCTSVGVTQLEVDAGLVSNTVTISGTPPSGTVPNQMATVNTLIAPTPSLSLSKTAAAPTTGFGVLSGATDVLDTIAYSFEVTNNGNVTIDTLVIDDPNPTFGGEASQNTISVASCPVTELAPGQSTTCTASYTLGQDDIDNAIEAGPNSVSNTATVSGTPPDVNGNPSAPISSPESTATTTIDSQPSIEIVKSVVTTLAAPNPTIDSGAITNITDPSDTITYTLTVTNTGNTLLSDINVTDILDPAVTCAGQANGSVTLLPAASIACEAVVTLDQDDLNTGSVTNTAAVEGVDPIGTEVEDDDQLTTLLNQRTSIELTKAASELDDAPNIIVGEVITYSFTLSNTGNVSLSNPNVQDPNCPSTLDLTTGFDGGDTNGNNALDVGEIFLFSCDYTTDQDDFDLGRVENTAMGTGTPPVASGLPDPMSTANSLAEIDQETAISLIKTGSQATVDQGLDDAITDIGDTITYSFEVANTGNVTLTNVDVTDPLITDPAGNNGSITCDVAADPGDGIVLVSATAPAGVSSTTCTAIYTLTQTDIDAGFVMNEASVSGTPPDTTPPADPPLVPPSAVSSSMVPIASVPRLTVAKTVSSIDDDVTAGTVVTYTYIVMNTGNTTIENVLPVDTNGPSFNGVAGDNSLTPFIATAASLPVTLQPNGSQEFTAQYTLSQNDIDNAVAGGVDAIRNTATATGDPVIGTLAAVTPSTALETVAGAPVIELLKSSDSPAVPVAVGSLINYTFTLENLGNVTITNPVVDDAQCVTPSGSLSFTNGFDSVDAELGEADELDVGETWTFSCSYPVDQTDIDAGTVQNTASATGQDPAGGDVGDTSDSLNPADTGANDDDPTNTPLTRTASFTVEKTTNSVPTQADDTLVYNFTLRNTGNVSITNPQVIDAKCVDPTTVTPAPSNGGADLISGDINGDNIITPTEVWVLSCTSIAVTQSEVDLANVPNNVSVTGTPPTGTVLDPALDSLDTPVSATPSLTVAKSASAPTQLVDSTTSPGDTITYTYDVVNTGNVTLTSIAINDAGPSFNNVAGENPLGAIACDDSSLIPTAPTSCEVDYVLTQNDIDNAIAGGANSVSNTATASGTPPPVNGNPSLPINSVGSTATTTVESAPAIELVKTVVANSITTALGAIDSITDVGDTISYNLAVSNTGNSLLSNIVVTDNIADSVTCPTTGDNTITSIDAGGATVNCTAVYTLNQENITAGTLDNQASVTGTDPFNTSVGDDDAITTGLPQTPLVSLIKSVAGQSTVNADGSFNQAFNFTLSNVGNVPLSNAQITDDLSTQFGACFVSVASPGTVSIVDVAPANDSSSAAVGTVPIIADIAVLGVGDSLVLSDFTAQFSQLASGCTFPDPAENSASATAVFGTLPPATDISDNQDDPANGVANDVGSPTPFTPPLPNAELGLAKAAEVLVFNPDTTFNVEFTMLLQNTGDVNINNLSLFDDIATQYGAAFVASDASVPDSGVISAPVVTLQTDTPPLLDSVLPTPNTAYDGGADSMITVSPTSVLGIGDVIQVVFTVTADPALLARPLDDFENIANASGNAPNTDVVIDDSNTGADPTTGSGGEGDPTIVSLADIASLPIVLGQLNSERISQNTIEINWQTQTEVANLGFNIYGRVDEQWQLLNTKVIPGKGDSVEITDYQVIVYSETDTIAISDIDGRGKETLHGPYMVGETYGVSPQRQATDWQDAIKRRETKQDLRREKHRQQMLERNRARQAKRTGTGG